LAYRIDALEDLLARLQCNLQRRQYTLAYLNEHGYTHRRSELCADIAHLEEKIAQVREELDTLLELQQDRWEADRAALESAWRRAVLPRPPRP